MKFDIRPWTLADRVYVMPMLMDCLVEAEHDGSDFAGSPHNAEILWGAGVVAAQQGDPVLLAVDPEASLLASAAGFLLWIPPKTELQFRDKLLFGFGTYVKPSRRRHGLSLMLREEAIRIARARGYSRVVGVGHSNAGQLSAQAAGFREYGIAGELIL